MSDKKPIIRRTLFIGLGGTGVKTLLRVKKRFYEVYGHYREDHKAPDFVKFLAVDTDGAEMKNARKTGYNAFAGGDHGQRMTQMKGMEKEIVFENFEMFHADGVGSKSTIMANRKKFSWIPQNDSIIRKMDDLKAGAGQTRLFGRVGFYWNAHKLRPKLDALITEMMTADNKEKDFDAPSNPDFHLDVVIVGSIAGGTGSGMFMDMGLLIKDICRNVEYGGSLKARTRGFFVLPDVFKSMGTRNPGVFKNVDANAAGALMELDLFETFKSREDMQGETGISNLSRLWNPASSPLQEKEMDDVERDACMNSDDCHIEVHYLNDTKVEIQDRPYDQVYLVGSSNDSGRSFSDIKDLSSSIAKALFTNCTAAADDIERLDNNARDLIEPYEGKNSWVRSIGVSEMIHNPYEVQKHLAFRMATILAKDALADQGEPTWAAAAARKMFMDFGLLQDGGEPDVSVFIDMALKDVNISQISCSSDDVERGRWMRKVKESDAKNKEARDSQLKTNLDEIHAKAISLLDMEALDKLIPEDGPGVLMARKHLIEAIGNQCMAISELLNGKGSDDEPVGWLKAAVDRRNDLVRAGGQEDRAENAVEQFKRDHNLIMRKLRAGEYKNLLASWENAVNSGYQAEAKVMALTELSNLVGAMSEMIQSLSLESGRSMTWVKDLADTLTDVLLTRRSGDIADENPTPFQINVHVEDMEVPLSMKTLRESGEDWSSRRDDALQGLMEILRKAHEHNEWWEHIDKDDLIDLMGKLKLNELALNRRGLIEKLRREIAKVEEATQSRNQPFVRTIGELLSRSEPLLEWGKNSKLSESGREFKSSLQKMFVIAVPDEGLIKGVEMLIKASEAMGDNKCKVVAAPDQLDRVTVYRREVAAPAFAVNSVADYMKQYKKREAGGKSDSGDLFHVNYNWWRAMNSGGIKWDLTQGTTHQEDNQQRLFAWGFIMGWIRFNKDKKQWIVLNSDTYEYVTYPHRNGNHRHELFHKLMVDGDGQAWIESLLQKNMNSLAELINGFGEIEEELVNPVTGKVIKKTANKYFKLERINPYAGSIPANATTGSATEFGGEYQTGHAGKTRAMQLRKEIKAIQDFIVPQVKEWRESLGMS